MQMSAEYTARAEQLLQRAQGGQWDPDTRLNWLQNMDLGAVKMVPPLISDRLGAAWPDLDPAARAEAIRTCLGTLLQNLAVGEAYVDKTIDMLQVTLPEESLRQILQWQVTDELRHASVLTRYVTEKLDWHQPATRQAASARLHSETDHVLDRWESGTLLVMILEIAATAAIQGLRSYCDEPLMQAMLKGVIGDESRHISGLTLCLRAYEYTWDDAMRERLKDTAILGWQQGLAVTERPACDMSDELDSRLATAPESPTTEWPFFRKTLSDILIPKLKILGLLDEDLAVRLRAVGCPVPEGAVPTTEASA